MVDDFEDPRLYCDILNPEYEEKANKIYEENKSPFLNMNTPVFNSAPTFEAKPEFTPSIPSPNFSMEDAFGTSKKEEDDKKNEPF